MNERGQTPEYQLATQRAQKLCSRALVCVACELRKRSFSQLSAEEHVLNSLVALSGNRERQGF